VFGVQNIGGNLLIGFIVNPIAGMGGRVGLKGTDGLETLEKAISMGAKPWSPLRAAQTLRGLDSLKDKLEWVTWSGKMGEEVLRTMGYRFEVIGKTSGKNTTSDDTKKAAKKMEEIGVDLILFAGGDGTASDIVDAVDMRVPILGIPSGVKMYSGVFASTPRACAQLIQMMVAGGANIAEREVMDIDEEAYRTGRLSASLKGYAKTPIVASLVLSGKAVGHSVDEDLIKESVASRVVEEMEPGTTYILGPGTTVGKVTELLGIEKTLLGIDVIRDGKLVLKDGNEKQLIEVIQDDTKIILSPLGGQGSILGRGNQQISPKIIRKVGVQNIRIISTPPKLTGLKELTVDTGDQELDNLLRGFKRVIIGYHEEKVVKIK
jgi:predicted polyphosphate/ATP-dependent NAD kinase